MPESPNIILLFADQWRGDCLSIAGHPAVETPHLDQLAHRGVRFTNAYVGVASCIAARAALFTGLTQRTHGRVGYADGVEWKYPVTLAGEMAAAGYQTFACGKMHVHPQRHKMGFEKVCLHDGMIHFYRDAREGDYGPWLREEMGDDCELYGHGMEANSWVARPWHLPEYTHPTYWVVSRCGEFLRQRDRTRPFFLFCSFVAPHPPLVPPRYYLDMYDQKDLPTPPVGDWEDKLGMDPHDSRWNSSTSCGVLDARAQHRAQAGYYGLITQIDHQIGRLLENLSDADALKNTIFLFSSDHGELLGDHHLFRKILQYQGSVSIPMLACGPGIEGGQVRDELIELRDVMPTILDLAGAPVPDSVEGLSMAPLLRGESPADWRGHLHGEHAAGPRSNHYVVDGRYKFCWFSQTGLTQLFDLQADPQELHDLIDDPAHAATAERLRRILIEELTGREEGYVADGELVVGRTPKAVLDHVRTTAAEAPGTQRRDG